MSFDKVSPGKNVPESFNVVIEIPMNADPIKYEVDKESGAIFVDRFMTTAMHYPTNYGYVPQTLSGDGDPVDVLVITPYPLHPGVVGTNVWRSVPWPLDALVKLFMIDSEEGAKTTLHCATSDAVAQQTGLYYDQCAEATPTPVARDAALAQALWTASEGWTQD